jgi:hypothetical protein
MTGNMLRDVNDFLFPISIPPFHALLILPPLVNFRLNTRL